VIHIFVNLAVVRPVKRSSTRNVSRFSRIVFRAFTFSSRFFSNSLGDRWYSLPSLRDQTLPFHNSGLDLCSLAEQPAFSFCFVIPSNMSCLSGSSSAYFSAFLYFPSISYFLLNKVSKNLVWFARSPLQPQNWYDRQRVVVLDLSCYVRLQVHNYFFRFQFSYLCYWKQRKFLSVIWIQCLRLTLEVCPHAHWHYTVRSEIRWALMKRVWFVSHEPWWVKTELNNSTLPVLHFNRCLSTECNETTAHFNGNFDTDNQISRSLSAQRLSERTVWWCVVRLGAYWQQNCCGD
jgi:hypothetical protein